MAEDDEPDTKRARLDEEAAAAPELEPEAGYQAGFVKIFPRGGSAGARAESRARGTGAVYGASKGACERVADGGDGAFVSPPPLCAHPRTSMLVPLLPAVAVTGRQLLVFRRRKRRRRWRRGRRPDIEPAKVSLSPLPPFCIGVGIAGSRSDV